MIQEITASVPFVVVPSACVGELAAGRSCKISVRFDAAGVATYEGTLSFTTNDQRPAPSVSLRGVGVKSR